MNVLEEAVIFATQAHEGQRRKLAKIPYILHPLEVAGIIGTMTDDLETMAAGALHDTIEDCHVDPMEIRRRFGPRVAALVQSETEDKLSNRPASETWYERKLESLLMLKHTTDRDVKILWMADKLSNIRSFYRSYLRIGNDVWLGMNQKDPKMQAWYYKTIAKYLYEELGSTAAYKEYVELVEKIFGKDDINDDQLED